MAFENWLKVNLQGTIFGVSCEYVQRFFTETLHPDPQAIDVYPQVLDQLWGALQPLVSEAYRLNAIQIDCGELGSDVFTSYVGYPDEAGLVSASDSQPSWLCVNLVRYPDNSVLEATYPDPTPFKNGRLGIAGVPEADVSGNFLIDGAISIWEAAAQSWLVLNTAWGVGTPNAYGGMLRRHYTGTPPVLAGTAQTTLSNMHVSQKLGSRVGRKP